jgi:hypothetical protein
MRGRIGSLDEMECTWGEPLGDAETKETDEMKNTLRLGIPRRRFTLTYFADKSRQEDNSPFHLFIYPTVRGKE